ncbi:MAG: hypothetical protein ABGX16_07835 [Pirellulales bacterium]
MPNATTTTKPALFLTKITASANEQDPRPRSIYVGVGGTIDIENQDGTTEAAVPVVAGTTIPCQFAKITAISGATIYSLHG